MRMCLSGKGRGTPYRGAALCTAARWLALCALLVAGTRQATTYADPISSAAATVLSTGGLNLRSGPGHAFDVVAVVPDGATVTVTGSGTPDNWLPAQYDGQLGWMDGAYLSFSAGEAPPSVGAVAPSDGLNLRAGPGTSYAVVTVLPAGTLITETGAPRNNWAPVVAAGASGWVDNAYLSNGQSPIITNNAVTGSGGAVLPSEPADAGGSTYTAASAAPVAAPVSNASASFAWPVDSRAVTTLFSPAHLGIDIAKQSGSPARAAADGTVSYAGGTACCGYGLHVIVDHVNGYQTLYAHFSAITVKVGDKVSQGQQLGLVGCTGLCTGPHVHFEVRTNGTRVDPLRYLPAPWEIR